jgi:hypothetical protein
MKSLHTIAALGLVAAMTCGVEASDGATTAASSAALLGCPASAYLDTPTVSKARNDSTVVVASASSSDDKGRFWQSESLRVSERSGVRLQQTSATGSSFGISQVASGLINDAAGPDRAAEPKLATLLLAALGVVTFVAKRRRLG